MARNVYNRETGDDERVAEKRLPWKGSPPPPVAERPTCKGCDKKLKPRVWSHVNYPRSETNPGHREWDGGYHGYDGFHSLTCALSFAQRAYAAGYRL
jgi:hypothetical protein